MEDGAKTYELNLAGVIGAVVGRHVGKDVVGGDLGQGEGGEIDQAVVVLDVDVIGGGGFRGDVAGEDVEVKTLGVVVDDGRVEEAVP